MLSLFFGDDAPPKLANADRPRLAAVPLLQIHQAGLEDPGPRLRQAASLGERLRGPKRLQESIPRSLTATCKHVPEVLRPSPATPRATQGTEAHPLQWRIFHAIERVCRHLDGR